MSSEMRTRKVFRKIEKRIIRLIGEEDANFILKKFGKSLSFLKTIILLPEWFNECFANKNPQNFSLLGSANLKAWIAYTIYDYVRDGKIPKSKLVKLISIANILNNESLVEFTSQAGSRIDDILHLYNRIDQFYIKLDNEKKYSFKQFSSIINEKSSAAATAAIIVTPEASYSASKKYILLFFKHYFTARQLSDDLDDYRKDLKLRINTPVTLISKKQDFKKIARVEIDLNFNKALKYLKKIDGFDHDKFTKNYVKAC